MIEDLQENELKLLLQACTAYLNGEYISPIELEAFCTALEEDDRDVMLVAKYLARQPLTQAETRNLLNFFEIRSADGHAWSRSNLWRIERRALKNLRESFRRYGGIPQRFQGINTEG